MSPLSVVSVASVAHIKMAVAPTSVPRWVAVEEWAVSTGVVASGVDMRRDYARPGRFVANLPGLIG
jgi:hypothetical protein